MNRAEMLRQSVEKKQQMQVEIMDRFNVLNSRWERDLGQILLAMREFQQAIQADTQDQKTLASDLIKSQQKSQNEAIQRQEKTATGLEQMYTSVVRTTQRSVTGWKLALILGILAGGMVGWLLRGGNPHEDTKLAIYFRQLASPELVQDVLRDGPESRRLLEDQRQKKE